MADNGKLSADDLNKVVRWLNEKTKGHPIVCSICQTANWTLSEHLVTATVVSPKGEVMLGGTTYPSASIICKNCGNTHFINAVMVGIIAPEKKGGDGNG